MLHFKYSNNSRKCLFICCSDVPPDVLTFTVTVYNKGKRSKDTEVAELTVELSSLTNGDEVRFQTLLMDKIKERPDQILIVLMHIITMKY